MPKEKTYNPRCSFCILTFDDKADKYAHVRREHYKATYDPYDAKGGHGMPYIIIERSSDLFFYCAVQDCDFSHQEHKGMQSHCAQQHHKQSLTFKNLRPLDDNERKAFPKKECRDLAEFAYKKILDADVVDKPKKKGRRQSNKQQNVCVAPIDIDEIEEKAVAPVPEQPLDAIVKLERISATALPRMKTEQEHNTQFNMPIDLEYIKPEPRDTNRNAFVDLTNSFDTSAAMSLRSSSRRTSSSATPDARTSAKRKADQDDSVDIEARKAALTASYEKRIQEESMKSMEDPNGDLGESLKRIEQITQIYEKGMEVLLKARK
ncbi:hypothetical protein BJ508DRAFT_308255 [Ascobolus immersus RN42]|uniref:Uncharacterized protein n=1 Tax=Ascobolus immersus RN42 TaxID=1160509 RepID=A0A3N4I050_ASCIM|nr:hypothetical protein BJ508DRAFT_308255 [Ascobolus immersus RN42]